MSTAPLTEAILYPESDGRPKGETELHQAWMIRIGDILRTRYREQKVYVAGDLLMYYHENSPARNVVPDVFVVFNCKPGRRRVFKTWVEQRVPDVVFEVTSKSTSRNDEVDKVRIYQELGVSEYFLYDPEAEYLDPPLQGHRLCVGGYSPIEAIGGVLQSEKLGTTLGLDGIDLIFTDLDSGKICMTGEETEHELRMAEQRARLRAEAELDALRAELRRLRGEQT